MLYALGGLDVHDRRLGSACGTRFACIYHEMHVHVHVAACHFRLAALPPPLMRYSPPRSRFPAVISERDRLPTTLCDVSMAVVMYDDMVVVQLNKSLNYLNS